jgi:hypothetical protein
MVHHSPNLLDPANPLVDLSTSVRTGMVASIIGFLFLNFKHWKSSIK